MTLTRPSLDSLIDKGIFLERGEVVRQSLRDLFRSHGIEPFRVLEEPAEEEG